VSVSQLTAKVDEKVDQGTKGESGKGCFDDLVSDCQIAVLVFGKHRNANKQPNPNQWQ
jgi:hypothetical protein